MALAGMAAGVRAQGWLSAERARGYGRLVAAAALMVAAALAASYLVGTFQDPHGRPLSTDFNAFWSAGRLALRGHAALAYDPASLHLEEGVGAQVPQHLPFMYPPTFLLLCLPLAAVGYLAALAVFVLGGYAACLVVLRRLLPRGWPLLPVLGFPGAVLNVISTQNGCLSAACFGGAMLLLERRPALAGTILGALIVKPQLGVCIPVALLAARRWTALLACGASAGAVILASWAVLGGQAWTAFTAFIPATRAISQSPNVWGSGVSVYSAARILGAGGGLAYACQAAASLAAVAGLAWACARRPGAGPEVAALVCATLMCTPYLMDYDLVCLAVPMAWMVRAAASGWRSWERAVLQVAYVYPLAARALTISAKSPVTPVVLGAVLAVVLARSLALPQRKAQA